ncbi:MAG: signal peptidase II [Agarilytica sp.]
MAKESRVNSASEEQENSKLLILWYAIAAIVVALDLFTKMLASNSLALYERINVMAMFDITLRHNYGAAFSFLAGAGGWQVWFFGLLAGAVSLVLIVWIAKIGTRKSLEVLGLALILGGAVGNLYDRVTLGYVVDFILVYYNDAYQFPAFNVADSAITAGAGILILDAIKKSIHEHRQKNQPSSKSTDSLPH